MKAKGKMPHGGGGLHAFDALHAKKICVMPGVKAYVDPILAMTRGKKNYEVEQTYACLDNDPVKIRYTQTKAEYGAAPSLSGKVKKRRQHGRGPLTILLEEAWREVIEQKQKKAQVVLRKQVKKRRLEESTAFSAGHELLWKMIGPEWFQELSPKQLHYVDTLGEAIFRDLLHRTCWYTYLVLGDLGLEPKPFHRYVEIALANCCASPVEFLLILYDLSGRKRTTYSVNDRILLSAIVHLTIEDTLKELHIRIPSPPRNDFKEAKKRAEIVKQSPVASPYLTDLRMTRDPLEPVVRPDKQYTRSRYFKYKETLKNMRIQICDKLAPQRESGEEYSPLDNNNNILEDGNEECDDPFTKIECELIDEWKRAQNYYNKLNKTRRRRCINALNKPSIYQACCNKYIVRLYNEVGALEKNVKKEEEEVTKTKNVAGVVASKKGTTTKKTKKKSKETTEDELTYCLCKDTTTEEQKVDENECQCPAKSKSSLAAKNSKQHETCEVAGCQLDKCGEMETTSSSDTIEDKTTNDLGQQAVCGGGGYDAGELLEVKQSTSDEHCHCREMMMERIKGSAERCPKCRENWEKKNRRVTRIISGLKEIWEENRVIPIIAGVKSKPICTCLERYEKEWARYERNRQVVRAQEKLKSLPKKFVINGTAVDRDGQLIYILSAGVEPQYECRCERMKEEEEAQRREIAHMPHMPEGCTKYVVSGVAERPTGSKVYIISGTTTNADCKCLQLLERFEAEHSDCMKLYRMYMEKIASDTNEYLNEASNYAEEKDDDRPTDNRPPTNLTTCDCCRCANYERGLCDCGLALETTDATINEKQNGEEEEDEEGENFDSSWDDSDFGIAGANNLCVCGGDAENCTEVEDNFNSLCSTTGEGGDSSSPPLIDDDLSDLKRFIILEKIPRKRVEQMALLKKALEQLAVDGFPLAKLPDVQSLPHFRLWFQMRCKKYWTRKEKETIVEKDKLQGALIERSQRKVSAEVNEKFLLGKRAEQHWLNSRYIRRVNAALHERYVSQVKCQAIGYARQFITTQRCYEHPTPPTFRDVYFAYFPAKMADVHAFRVYCDHEARNAVLNRRKGA